MRDLYESKIDQRETELLKVRQEFMKITLESESMAQRFKISSEETQKIHSSNMTQAKERNEAALNEVTKT